VDDGVRALLEGPNYVHVATLMPDGSPHSVAMWGGVEDDHVIIFTGSPASRKARNLAADGRVAISIIDHDNPYRTAQVRGHVVDTNSLRLVFFVSVGIDIMQFLQFRKN
jgi:PPOX class probable F420-dependent enzyme